MDEDKFENFILDKYAISKQQINTANISFSNFKQYSHFLFTKIKNLVYNNKLQLNVKKLFLEVKFCYLYQDDAHYLDDLLSTFQQDLELLSLNLIGNYLSLYGLSQILKSISRLFPKLNRLIIDFSVNSSAHLHKVDIKKFDGFHDIIKLNSLKSIDLNLNQAVEFSNFFECLKNPQSFPSNLKEIFINCQQLEYGQSKSNFFENFSFIFERLPQLEYLDLNFTSSYTSGILTFLNALKNSRLQKFVLDLYKGKLNETPSQIMNTIFQSQYLKYLDINFRMAANNSTDCLEVFQNLHKCTNLEILKVSLKNNDIENLQLITFADHLSKTPTNLSQVNLDLTNDYKQKRLSQEYINHLEFQILQIPNLTHASISFTETNAEKHSQRLKQYSQQAKALIQQNIAFKKLIGPFMVFNPTFISQDLFF